VQNSYRFAAVRGVQAGHAYYVVMVPLRVVAQLFRFDDEELPPQLRSQRALNRSRVPAIGRYIVDNPQSYVLSALSASIDGGFSFSAVDDRDMRSVGMLTVDMTACIVINDGQHRRAGIVEALRDHPHLGNETIAVTMFPDRGLARAQQMFVDLNQHGVRPARSLRLFYDERDPSARLAREVAEAVPLFRDLTDFTRSTVPAGSRKLFAFSSLHAAIQTLSHDASAAGQRHPTGAIVAFWNGVVANMPDWRLAGDRAIATSELRRDMVHAHGIALEAIAMAGARLMAEAHGDWADRLSGLSRIDWSRSNTKLWEGRALVGGRINRSRTSVAFTADLISQVLAASDADVGQEVG